MREGYLLTAFLEKEDQMKKLMLICGILIMCSTIPATAIEIVPFQSIPTNGALDWDSFTIEGDSYLAVANH